MRKRSLLSVIDKIVWLVIALLPIISYLFCVRLGLTQITNGAQTLSNPTFTEFCEQFFFSHGFTQWGNGSVSHIFMLGSSGSVNIFYLFFGVLFGDSSVGFDLPFVFNSEPIICCLAWFCTVQIMHFFVDVLLFIPRLCQKFIEVKE